MEYVGERISVMAAFFTEGKKFKPLKFKWSTRVISVENITYSWTDRIGHDKIYHFSVTDGRTFYELSFNSGSLLWFLEKVDTEVY